jgi:glyoxylate carboligase
MAQNVADFFWMRLHQWGVRCVFGYPGDGINGLLGGLQRLGEDKIRFIQVRHEEMAAFMASAYAKFTGKLGVCIATSGPGASHLITGLYDARLDHMPVLAIAGQQRAPLSADIINKKSIWSACSRTWPAPSFIRPACRHRCGIWWIAPFALRSASAV